MDVLVRDLYKAYGEADNIRMFPRMSDGLRPVERRVIYSVYEIAREKFAKCAKVDGYVTGNYHPHASCYGTIVQLANQGFLDRQGNFGSDIGVESCPPAASRYTETRLMKSTYDMALKYIDYVPMDDTEFQDGSKEPRFLPTMFPFCLVGTDYMTGIGFGYRTSIPSYKISDLYQRLLWLKKKRKDEPIISPVTDCKILSGQDELKKLLTTGKATLQVKGIYEKIGKSNQVILKSIPPGKKFETFIRSFDKELENQDIGFMDLSTETVGTSIQFQVLKQRNSDTIYAKFIKTLDEALIGNISFEMIAIDSQGCVKTTSVDEMLLTTYNVFSLINTNMLNIEILSIKSQIDEYKMLDIIRPSLAKHIGLSILNMSPDEIIKKIHEETKVPIEKISYLISKYRISKLINISTDTTQLKEKLSLLENNKSNIEKFVLSQYSSIVK